MADLDFSGRMLGEFVLRERIDEGGFGAVYRCEQPRLGREAVVKVLRQEVSDGSAASERFKREARLASRLDHPFAAHIYAFGVEEADGLRWIAMELVHGVTLRHWLHERGPMSLEQFVPFFERVAQVVQTAHDRGIVHRDLKPSNVMVVERAGELLPKLLDFGVAKELGDAGLPGVPAAPASPPLDPATTVSLRSRAPGSPPIADASRLTPRSAVVGSPPYMAPEQWTDPIAVGPRADLYALGIIAYEALTGRRPFDADTEQEFAELHRTAIVPSVGAGLPSTLDPVLARAMAKRPADRWESALDLAAALRAEADARLVAHVRTSARQWHDRGRPAGLLWRGEAIAELDGWAQRTGRTKAGLTATEIAFVEATRELAVADAEAQARRARRKAWAQRATILAGLALMMGMFEFRTMLADQHAETAKQVSEATAITAEVEQGRAAVLHDDLAGAQQHFDEAWRRGDHSPTTAFMRARASQPLRAELARLQASSGRMWWAAFSPDGRQIVTTDDRAAQIWNAETHRLLFALPHADTVYHAVYSADGTRLVTAGGDEVRIWNISTGSLVRELRLRDRTPRYFRVAVSPDGRCVAAVDLNGAVAAVWDAATGAVLTELALDGKEWPSIAFSNDGRLLAAGGGNDVHVLDVTNWRQVAAIPGQQIGAIAWAPDGPRLATGSSAGDVSIWAMPRAERQHHLREIGEPVGAVAFSGDGRLVAAGSQDGSDQVFDARSGQLVSQGNQLHGKIQSIEFDRSSQLIVAAGATGAAAVADVASGMAVTVLEGPQQQLRVAHFDPRSQRVLGASWDGTARIWDAASPYRRWTSAPIADGCGLIGGTEPAGRFLAVACPGHATRVWDTSRNQLLAELPALAPPSGDLAVAFPAVSPAGDRAAIARGATVELYELPGGRLLRAVAHSAAVTAVAFGADGELASGAADGSLLVTRERTEPVALPPATNGIDAVAVLAGGRVATADADAHIRVLDQGKTIAEFAAPARIRMLRPSPDGRSLVTVPGYAGKPSPAMLWDLEHHRLVARLDGPATWSARWVQGGEAILAAGADGAARLWGTNGALRVVYNGGSRFLADADLTADGAIVVGGGGDGMLRFWDTTTGRPLWATAAHKTYVMGVSVDGPDIVTRGSSGEISRWHLPEAADVIEPRKMATSGP